MKLLLTISALLFAMGSFAQNADDLADKETTIQFSKKVKFPDILLAGQPRSNSRYCNGESCPIPLSNTVLDGNNKVLMPAARQHLKYRKAKISKIGFVM